VSIFGHKGRAKERSSKVDITKDTFDYGHLAITFVNYFQLGPAAHGLERLKLAKDTNE